MSSVLKFLVLEILHFQTDIISMKFLLLEVRQNKSHKKEVPAKDVSLKTNDLKKKKIKKEDNGYPIKDI